MKNIIGVIYFDKSVDMDELRHSPTLEDDITTLIAEGKAIPMKCDETKKV